MQSPKLLELPHDWWRIAHPQVWMFPGRDRINPMTTRQLNRACHIAAELAGLPNWVRPHTLRHSRHAPARAEGRYGHDSPHWSNTSRSLTASCSSVNGLPNRFTPASSTPPCTTAFAV
jgi:integrase